MSAPGETPIDLTSLPIGERYFRLLVAWKMLYADQASFATLDEVTRFIGSLPASTPATESPSVSVSSESVARSPLVERWRTLKANVREATIEFYVEAGIFPTPAWVRRELRERRIREDEFPFRLIAGRILPMDASRAKNSTEISGGSWAVGPRSSMDQISEWTANAKQSQESFDRYRAKQRAWERWGRISVRLAAVVCVLGAALVVSTVSLGLLVPLSPEIVGVAGLIACVAPAVGLVCSTCARFEARNKGRQPAESVRARAQADFSRLLTLRDELLLNAAVLHVEGPEVTTLGDALRSEIGLIETGLDKLFADNLELLSVKPADHVLETQRWKKTTWYELLSALSPGTGPRNSSKAYDRLLYVAGPDKAAELWLSVGTGEIPKRSVTNELPTSIELSEPRTPDPHSL